MSVPRQFDRHGKTGYLSQGRRSTTLDRFNDKLAGGVFLHPTKGYRRISVKRSKAAMITAQMKVGQFPPAILSWRTIKKILESDSPT